AGETGATVETADSPLAIPAMDTDALIALARRLSSTLVVYWIHESGSYAWVIDRQGEVHAASLAAGPTQLRRTVQNAVDVPPELEITADATTTPLAKPYVGRTFRSAISSRSATDTSIRSSLRSLYRTLWAPIAKFVPQDEDSRVTVIPHGPLLALP